MEKACLTKTQHFRSIYERVHIYTIYNELPTYSKRYIHLSSIYVGAEIYNTALEKKVADIFVFYPHIHTLALTNSFCGSLVILLIHKTSTTIHLNLVTVLMFIYTMLQQFHGLSFVMVHSRGLPMVYTVCKMTDFLFRRRPGSRINSATSVCPLRDFSQNWFISFF